MTPGVQGRHFERYRECDARRSRGTLTSIRVQTRGRDLQPLIDESVELRFNMWCVVCMGSIHQNGTMDLRRRRLCAGAFHSRATQRVVQIDELTKACAVAWQSGLRL